MLKHTKLIAGALTCALSLTLASSALAEQVMEELDDPVTVELQSAIQAENAQAGQEFSAVLNEEVRYREWIIPQGTVFKGAITKVGRSHPLSRPGYVLLQVHSATLPDGRVYDFKPQLYEPRRKRLHNPEAQTFRDTVVQQLPYTAVSLGTSLPLRYGADMNRWIVLPITVGARMALGAGIALFDDDLKGRNVAYKLGYGMWQGTGIPRAWRFITKDPEPNFQPGDEIPIYFNEKALEIFFETAAPRAAATEPLPQAAGPADEGYAVVAAEEPAQMHPASTETPMQPQPDAVPAR